MYVTLLPWHERVADGRDRLTLCVDIERRQAQALRSTDDAPVAGAFAYYERHLFGAFLSGDVPCLVIARTAWALTPGVRTAWSSTTLNRSFVVKDGSRIMRFEYGRVLWNLVRSPARLMPGIRDFDLPAWTDERWRGGDLREALAKFVASHATSTVATRGVPAQDAIQ